MQPRKLVFFDCWADPIAEDILHAHPLVDLIRLSIDDPPAKIWNALATAHGYQWPRPPYLGTAEVIARCPNLLGMASQRSGCDVMDFDACNEAGILIVNQAGLGGRDAVASHALAMMLGLSKQLIQADKAMRRDRKWQRLDFSGEDLFGKTVGIIGFGEIGTRLGALCRAAFDMTVLVYDPYLTAEHVSRFGGTKCELQDMLGQSDFVSVHCPLTRETRGMIGVREFAAMRPGAFFVATARGEIYDERAIEHALKCGHLAGAGLDVWETEPPPLDHPLLQLDNVVASPHIAGVTRRAYRSVAEGAALQWIDIFEGKRPPRLVNKEVWPRYKERYYRIFGEPVA